MSQQKMIIGSCPKCGEELQIPGHLEEFSCLYCGIRLTPSAIAPVQVPVGENDPVRSASYYREHVIETITNHIGIDKEMTGTRYPAAFDAYTSSNKATFQNLDNAVSGGAITLEDAANWYIDQLEARWDKDTASRIARQKCMEEDKFVIAIFLVPMVRELHLSISEEYCSVLQALWIKRYPKSPFYLGTYQELCSGFQKKFLGLCYITTAICRRDGKPDDCAELTAFRNFRDGYLRACPDGPSLISEYYNMAPGIVLRIELSDDRDARYATIRDQYLLPCYEDLQAGNLRSCKERYVSMMRTLEQEYLH